MIVASTPHNFMVPVMFGFMFVLAFILFSTLPPRRAMIGSYLFGFLFLPIAFIAFKGLPDITKLFVVSLAVLTSVVVFDLQRLMQLRPRWYDLPMLIYVISPFPAAMTNDMGAYNAIGDFLYATIVHGVPYLMGRAYLTRLDGLKEAAIAMIVGGLVYIPFILFEIRMSPRLHNDVYGFMPHSFLQHVRETGYRPMVFMAHGIQVSFWLASASLAAFGLWFMGGMRRIGPVPLLPIVLVLFATTILSKTTLPILLLFAGAAGLVVVKFSGRVFPIAAAAMIPVLYICVRATGIWSGDQLVGAAASIFGETRAGSLEFRIENEDLLAEKARVKPIFGWGGHGGNRVQDEAGNDITTIDGQWILLFGMQGVVGMVSFYSIVLLPVLLFWRRIPRRRIRAPAFAPAAIYSILLVMWSIHVLMNTSNNPFCLMAAGGLIGLHQFMPARFRVRAAARLRSQSQVRSRVRYSHSR